MRRIRKLARDVRDRIAAGEVIQRPSSAVKELLENSIDAGSTTISVVIKGGGMKLLQVQDDGHGMHVQDLRVACERFATSKLSSFGDLRRIESYGFRGEALASIAHVAHVTIVSRCAGQKCAFRAQYREGAITGTPRPCAGVPGTTITVTDLFYNVKARLEALRGVNDGGKRILDVVSRYAVHYANPANSRRKQQAVAFNCRRAGKAMPEIRTTGGTAPRSSCLGAIRTIFGKAVSEELIAFSCGSSASEANGEFVAPGALFTVQGLVSNVSHSFRKRITILFFNHRLVQCSRLKRAIASVYADFLPRQTHPFVYLSIQMPPSCVDVNVHPTKKEVRFLHEENVLSSIQSGLQNLLRASVSRTSDRHRQLRLQMQVGDGDATSRWITTRPPARPPQSLLSRSNTPRASADTSSGATKTRATMVANSARRGAISINGPRTGRTKEVRADNTLVRTDSATGAIEAYMVPTGNAFGVSGSAQRRLAGRCDRRKGIGQKVNCGCCRGPIGGGRCTCSISRPLSKLSSVQTLCSDIRRREHAGLSAVMRCHVFIGLVDDAHALVQHGTTVYLVRHMDMFRELLYQRAIRSFSRFRPLLLSQPLSVRDLVAVALARRDDEATTTIPASSTGKRKTSILVEYAAECLEMLQEKAAMIAEYFSIEIDAAGRLRALPDLLPGWSHYPRIDCLAQFILRLCEDVEWSDEKACFSSLAWELADFFSLVPQMTPPRREGGSIPVGLGIVRADKRVGQANLWWSRGQALLFAKTVVFPACRNALLPPVHFSAACAGVFTKVTSLQHLYKIFERC